MLPLKKLQLGEYKQWNGLLEWNTGLDYWTDFLNQGSHFSCEFYTDILLLPV